MTRRKAAAADAASDVAAAVVLCTGRVAGVTYSAGCVIEGIPMDVAEAHTNVLNLSSDAVALAKERGAAVVQFAG